MKRIVCLLVCFVPFIAAQEKSLSCEHQGRWNRDGGSFCEMREVTIPASRLLDVDGGNNGGVTIKGWDRNEVLVRSQVQTSELTDAAARQLASQISVQTSAGRIRATGPGTSGRHQGWGVSFEVFVPRQTDLALKTNNGGVHIDDVHGHIQFEAQNGGAHLARLGGDVEGHTTNGGVHLELAGDHWDGAKCDVSTTNGGVNIQVPSNYSAHLEASTVNGGVHLDFPVTVSGDVKRQIATDLGSGGNLVRATTTNGGVHVTRL